MEHESTSEHLAGTLEHLNRHWASRRQAMAAKAGQTLTIPDLFTIAIEREAGSQGSAIAQEVGKRLGWQVYDHELLERVAQDMGLRSALLQNVDEKRQSWVTETFEALLQAPVQNDWQPLVTESAYVHHLVKTVLTLGAHGECVIVGRGAAVILPLRTTLRVRLVAPIKHRIATWSRREGISPPEAARQIRTIDRERTDFVQDWFFKDPTDPRNYDMVLNVSRYSVNKSAELITAALP